MTWEEFRDAIGKDPVLVIPIGSTELAGLHLPLGADTIVANEFAKLLAGEEGVIVCPALPIGYSKWFNPFPGTISLEHDTLTKVLLEYCRCLLEHGARRLLFLNAHKGNNSSIETAARILISEKNINISMLSIWKLANDLTTGLGIISEGKFTHAGEIMTSILLKLKPETVVMEKIKPDRIKSPDGSKLHVLNTLGETSFRGSTQSFYQDIRTLTETGIAGDPTNASAELGGKIVELIDNYLKAFIKEFRKLPLECHQKGQQRNG
ncbi:MAG: creatininase family protein [Syntrophales bacterium]